MSIHREVPESQFAYVVIVARRARQLMIGGQPLVENPRAHKTTRIAEEELQQGMLEYELPETAEEDSDGAGKRRRS